MVINPTTYFKLIAPITVTFAPRLNGFKSSTLLPHFERAPVSVNPNQTPLSSQKTRFLGSTFSPFPNIYTSEFALFQGQTDYCVWSFFSRQILFL